MSPIFRIQYLVGIDNTRRRATVSVLTEVGRLVGGRNLDALLIEAFLDQPIEGLAHLPSLDRLGLEALLNDGLAIAELTGQGRTPQVAQTRAGAPLDRSEVLRRCPKYGFGSHALSGTRSELVRGTSVDRSAATTHRILAEFATAREYAGETEEGKKC